MEDLRIDQMFGEGGTRSRELQAVTIQVTENAGGTSAMGQTVRQGCEDMLTCQ